MRLGISIEEDEELNEQLSQELELERAQNDFLEEENRELRSKLAELEKNYKKLAEDAGKREEELISVKEKDRKISSLMRLNEGLDEDKKKMEAEVENLRKHLQSAQESKQQLEKEKIDLEGKLKDLNSQLSAAEVKKKSSENEVSKLQKQVQILEESKEWELAGIDGSLKETFLSVMELLAQQLPLNNQEQQKLEEKLKDVDKRLEDIDGETKKSQEQTKAYKPDAVSLVSTVSTEKSTTSSSRSTLSKLRNLPNKLFGDKNLNNFLSRKNEELKKGFPEFKEKHFCHNVLDETIKSLLNKNSGKFESKELLKLLENNLKQSAREIIEAKVKEVAVNHTDDTQEFLLPVGKYINKLKLDKESEKEITSSMSGNLSEKAFAEGVVRVKMRKFSDNVQELASSIRDKFLSPNQKMCSRVLGERNTYQLSANKASTPHSSMSHTNIASIHSLNNRKAVKVGF